MKAYRTDESHTQAQVDADGLAYLIKARCTDESGRICRIFIQF